MRAHGCAASCFRVILPTVFGSHAGNYEIMDLAVRCVRMVALPCDFMAMSPTVQLCRFYSCLLMTAELLFAGLDAFSKSILRSPPVKCYFPLGFNIFSESIPPLCA